MTAHPAGSAQFCHVQSQTRAPGAGAAMISESPPGTRETVRPQQRPACWEVAHGREPEQKIVRDLLQRAQRQTGGVVLVDGEPGIGRSLLLRDSVQQAADRGFSLVAGAADPLGQAIPFFEFRAALPELFAGLAAGESGRNRPDATVWWVSQIRAHLEQRAAAVPVLVCLDDLNWASPATLAALRALPRDLRRQPVAWLLARSSAPRSAADHLFGRLQDDGAARITLAPLGHDAVAAMLTEAFGAPPEQPLRDLADRAAGNPSLLTELIKGLRHDKAVRVSDGRAVLVSAGLPRRIHHLAQWRLAALSTGARQLLLTAAVLGPAFCLEDAAEMLGQPPAALLPAIEEAMGAGIMTAAEQGFSFRQPLLRQAVSEMIPAPARRALHRQYGEILLDRGRPAQLAAGHLIRAAHADDPTSLARLDTAAAQTMAHAPQTAADLAARALELTPAADPGALPRAVAAAEALTAAGRLDQAERIVASLLAKPVPPPAEARLRCALSSIMSARGQTSDARAEAGTVLARPRLTADLRDQATTAYVQALAGLRDEQAGPAADAILAAPGEYSVHTAGAARLARALIAWDNGQVGRGLKLMREAARHSPAISPDARHVQPLLTLAAALIDLRQLEEAENILRGADGPALRGIPAQAAPPILRARILLAQGRLAAAADAGQEALTTAEAMGAYAYANVARGVLGLIALRRGDLAAAEQHLAGRPTLMAHVADTYARAETILVQAQVTEARDGPETAVRWIRELSGQLQTRPGLLLGDPALAAWLVRTAVAGGDAELAVAAAGAAGALADAQPEFPALAAAAAHSRGLADRDPALLAEAAAQHPDAWARASATEDLAVLAPEMARDQAIRHLKSALDGYRQAGAERDQARVRRRLRQLGIRRRHWATPPARPVTGWDSLTGTEQAVARLVAEGLNNSQAAARMYISTHTVAHHLRQAFRKLSIASRVELTRIVIEQAGRTAPDRSGGPLAQNAGERPGVQWRPWPPDGRP
jgi:DNA-binding CsgD family transcriptional regulator